MCPSHLSTLVWALLPRLLPGKSEHKARALISELTFDTFALAPSLLPEDRPFRTPVEQVELVVVVEDVVAVVAVDDLLLDQRRRSNRWTPRCRTGKLAFRTRIRLRLRLGA